MINGCRQRLSMLALSGMALLFTGALALSAPFDWPQWQGSDRTGVSKETGLLKIWPKEGPPLVWKITGAGLAHSTPSVAAGQIFLMGNRDKKEMILAFSEKDGKELWATPIGPSTRGGDDPGPRCTPTVDGELVYAMGCKGDLVCVEAGTGKELWRRQLKKEFDGSVGGWEYSESPLIDGDKLICSPGGSKATMVALDKKTGKTIWESAIPEGDRAEYASPIVADVQGVRQYIQFLGKGVVSVNAADGKFLWTYKKPANGTANCSTPIYADNHIFAASGYGTGGGLAEIIKEGTGSFKIEPKYFTKEMKNHHGGMVLVNGYIYGSNEGQLACIEFKTGKVMWQKNIGKGSIAYADGRLYYRDEGNKGIFLVEANPEKYVEQGMFKQPERSKLPAWPHPVIANGKLYIRDMDTLLCFDIKEK